ncbi:glucoamylase family protein [Niabella ginsengisoli]|uniref:Beta-glucosidase n=1 Tax=Niabella ginsengisoli TaxID=522298 RepID=A0ABS9SMP7_9BACT|nr:glucoamylase family protein [Niabella ginsengisoli]MCH5599655.1 beta-glucosidase [Niabella ginsengisoli]
MDQAQRCGWPHIANTFFFKKAEKHHGAFSHWVDGSSGKCISFSKKDDGADIVETSFLFQGLLTARQYFNKRNKVEEEIRNIITELWENIDWNWFTRGRNTLYWHWSPNHNWAMNLKIEGYNEALITYVLAAASPKYSITKEVYDNGWARNGALKNGKKFYNTLLPAGPDYAGPLFFAHFGFAGLDPRGLKDSYVDYGRQNIAHATINYKYCVDNPQKFEGYNEHSWGLSACDYKKRYHEQSPLKDNGTICCSAALASMPYTPRQSMRALRYFYEELGDKLFGEYGFNDSYNITMKWYADSYLAINQGITILMIENFRTGLLWNLFMKDKDVKTGLQKLGFKSPWLK